MTAFALNVQDGPFFALGNDVVDDGPAIQAAINAAASNGFDGSKVLIPPGRYRIPNGIVVKSGVELCGSARRASILLTGTSDAAHGVTFDETASYGGMCDMSVYGNDDPGTLKNTVHIANNAMVNLTNLNVFRGYNALFTGGVDGKYDNCFFATARNANVVSIGSNWYVRCKLDVETTPAGWAFYQSQSFGGPIISENHFTQGDFTGAWRNHAIEVNDLESHAAIVALDGCVLGGSAKLTSARWLSPASCEVGPDTYNNDIYAAISATGSFGNGVTCSIHGPNVKVGNSCHNIVAVP